MIVLINEEVTTVIRMFIYIGQKRKETQGTGREEGRRFSRKAVLSIN